MTKRILALMLAAAMLLCGCGSGQEPVGGNWAVVYRLDSKAGGGLVRERIALSSEPDIDELVEALNSLPKDAEMLSAFPEGLVLLGAELKNGCATVTVSSKYLSLSLQEKLKAESAIVLSLSTLDEVCYVDIVCNGTTRTTGLSVEAIAEADGVCGEYEHTLKLYLPDWEGKTLRPVAVTKLDDGTASLAEAMLRELFAYIGGGVEDTVILSLSIAEGICTVDLSQEFYSGATDADRNGELIIYSIVNSLCRIPGVDTVTLTVDGMGVASYGRYTTLWPLEQQMSLVSYQEN